MKGIEVNQNVQVQAEPYYSGPGPDPDDCTAAAEFAVGLLCNDPLFAPQICQTWPSLQARDLGKPNKPVSYTSLGNPLATLTALTPLLVPMSLSAPRPAMWVAYDS